MLLCILALGSKGDETGIEKDGKNGSEICGEGEDEEDQVEYNKNCSDGRFVFLFVKIVDCVEMERQRIDAHV